MDLCSVVLVDQRLEEATGHHKPVSSWTSAVEKRQQLPF